MSDLLMTESHPPHCRKCGREMIPTTQDDGYDREGNRIISEWWECPRFARSWRNLWQGGITHYAEGRGESVRGMELRWLS